MSHFSTGGKKNKKNKKKKKKMEKNESLLSNFVIKSCFSYFFMIITYFINIFINN